MTKMLEKGENRVEILSKWRVLEKKVDYSEKMIPHLDFGHGQW